MVKPEHLQRGASVLVMFCLLSSLELLHRTLGGGEKPQGMELQSFRQRMSPVKSLLPANATVGYVSDLKPDPSLRSELEYRMTQYALVPAIVEEGTRHEYVIGNFHGPALSRDFAAEQLTLIKDFGNGVLLLRGGRR